MISRRSLLVMAAASLSGDADLMSTEDLAADMKRGQAPKIICVAFPVLYRQRHIKGALFAGPTRDGVEALDKLVSSWDKNDAVVLYCGCCPMERCPNVGPAYDEMKRLGFRNTRVLRIPENFHTDWIAKGYPVDS